MQPAALQVPYPALHGTHAEDVVRLFAGIDGTDLANTINEAISAGAQGKSAQHMGF